MTGAIAPLTDFNQWARGSLLVIVLLILAAILFTRLAVWVRGRIMARIDAHASEADELVRSEAAKHRQVVAQVVTWAVLAVLYVVTAVLVVERLGVPLGGLIASAALLSAALGFGLQRFVQDIGAGLFITGERQYGFGDVIRITAAGVSEPAIGTVEDGRQSCRAHLRQDRRLEPGGRGHVRRAAWPAPRGERRGRRHQLSPAKGRVDLLPAEW